MEEHIKWLLENYGQNDQRTDAWHSKRGEMLTASEIYKACKDATPAQRHEIILSKLTPREVYEGLGPRSLMWGTRYEPIAKSIYEHMKGVNLVDTSCVPHPEQTFLGASPDGIIVTPESELYGSLVEFKCPISREIDESLPIPSTYFHQMQLQMECTRLNTCQYIEMQFKEMNYSTWLEHPSQYKSVFLVSEDGLQTKYRDFNDPRSITDWKDAVTEGDDSPWMFVFWALTKHTIRSVDKDPEWLATHLSSFQEVWTEVQKHRAAGTLPEHPKEKTTLAL